MKLSEISPYPDNPREIPDQAVQAVAESIRQYGFQQPIMIDPNKIIIAGHTRWLAAKALGMKTIPVIVAHLSPEKADALRIADNRTNELTGWDQDKLRTQLGELKPIGIAGFDPGELDYMTAPLPAADELPDITPKDSWKDRDIDQDKYVIIKFKVPRSHAKEIRTRLEAIIDERQPNRRK